MHRVLLVGPWRSHRAGGCCAGAVDSHDGRNRGDGTASADDRSRWAAVYLAVRSAVGEAVDVQLVDPRNSLFLLPAVYRDARRGGRSPVQAVAAAVRATTPGTLIVDGTILARSVSLTPEQAVRLLPAGLSSAR